jgi:hypothetical protein
MGECRLYSEWKAKFKGKPIPIKADDRVNKMLGDKIFFTLVERNCQKFDIIT